MGGKVWKWEKVCMVVNLAWPPSINHAYISIGGGKKRLKPEYIRYRDDCAYATLAAMSKSKQGKPPPPYILVVAVWKPDKRKRDLDNLMKVLQDGIFMGLNTDDSNISTIVVKHRGYVRHGAIRVFIATDDSAQWYDQYYKVLDNNPLEDLTYH